VLALKIVAEVTLDGAVPVPVVGVDSREHGGLPQREAADRRARRGRRRHSRQCMQSAVEQPFAGDLAERDVSRDEFEPGGEVGWPALGLERGELSRTRGCRRSRDRRPGARRVDDPGGEHRRAAQERKR